MRTALFIFLVSLRMVALCQEPARYDALVKDAFAHYQKKTYRASAGRYSAAFEALGWKGYPQDRYSSNQVVVTRILDERGWLGADIVGRTGNSTLFLVIQHADIATQEKYLPMMREAVAKGNAEASSLALLEDRVLIRHGERQLYGSQVARDKDTGDAYLSPLEDPDHVDERRTTMGLGPLAGYLMNWNMEWDVEAYKKQLPLIEERLENKPRTPIT